MRSTPVCTGAECYQISVVGYPADTNVGPFCPTTTSDIADEVGIWFDGEEVYDIDGDFILDLPEIYEDDNWHLHDDDGTVHVTDTQEAFEAAARPNVDPEYQNHCVEGETADPGGGDTPAFAYALDGYAIHSPLDDAASAHLDECNGHTTEASGYHYHANQAAENTVLRCFSRAIR